MTDVEIKVGSVCWIFDVNARQYRGNELIWRAHWVKHTVRGENRTSWLVGHSGLIKIPKKHPGHTNRDAYGTKQVVWNEAELDLMCWDHDNRRLVVDAIRQPLKVSTEQLIEVAKLINYEVSAP